MPDKPSLFPLIRHISARLTPLLVRLPVTANQITTASMILGLAVGWLLTRGTAHTDIAAGALLVSAYVLDNCDGEVARAKGQCTTFGMHYDTFADWVVHTAFFIGLGFGVQARLDDDIWLWMGIAAAAGGTINYGLGWLFIYLDKEDEPDSAQSHRQPETPAEWLVFAFRELARADFCFLVLALAIPGSLWLLLPAGMVGAQVYWMALCIKNAGQFHA